MLRRQRRRWCRLGCFLAFVVVAAPQPSSAQEPAPAERETAPGQTPTVPGQAPTVPGEPTPPAVILPAPLGPTPTDTVPVIPDTQLLPNPTVPSAPQRVLPAAAFRGPASARLQFAPTITVSEEYTDNFNLTARDKRSNYRTTVAPGLDVTINSAFVKGLISYKFAPAYDTITDDVSQFHSLLGQIVWDATPYWRLSLADTFTQSDQPVEADRLGLRQQRQKFTSNTASIASDYLLGLVATRQSYQLSVFSDDQGGETTSHTAAISATIPLYQTNSLSVGYEYLNSTTSGENGALGTSGDVDVTGHRFTAGVTRRINHLQTVGIIGSYALRSTSGDGITDADFQLWNVGFVSEYSSGRLKINSLLGVSGLTGDSGQSLGPDFSTRTNITYRFAHAVVSIGADQGFSETFTDGQNFGVIETKGVNASLAYPFTPLFSGTILGSYRKNKTTGFGPTSVTAVSNQESEVWTGTLLLSWQPRKWLGVDVSYVYTRHTGADLGQTVRTGATNDQNYSENRVRLGVNLSF